MDKSKTESGSPVLRSRENETYRLAQTTRDPDRSSALMRLAAEHVELAEEDSPAAQWSRGFFESLCAGTRELCGAFASNLLSERRQFFDLFA